MIVHAIDISKPSENPLAIFGNIASILNLVLPLVTIAAALLFLIMLFRAAFTILTGAGTAENIAKAQKTMTNAIIGLILIISAYTIVRLVAKVLKLDIPL
ncbi:MAG: hypothetical protein Q7S61_04370 [bacterium]|nr:hypothetical protein [bacterium]